jgi:hypothetical protein
VARPGVAKEADPGTVGGGVVVVEDVSMMTWPLPEFHPSKFWMFVAVDSE